MTDKNPYEVLGVSKDAPQGNITKAFRRKAQQLHPDKEGGSQEAFQEIQDAYTLIGTVEARKDFDNGKVPISANDVRKNLYASMQAAIAEDPLRPVLPRLRSFISTETANIKTRLMSQQRKLKALQLNADRMKVAGDRPNMFRQAMLGHIEDAQARIQEMNSTLEMLSLVRTELQHYEEEAVVDPSQFDMSTEPLGLGVTWKAISN